MTGHSPESTTGRLPENMDEENIEDDGFQDAVTERYFAKIKKRK